jgi:hypothetical protein
MGLALSSEGGILSTECLAVSLSGVAVLGSDVFPCTLNNSFIISKWPSTFIIYISLTKSECQPENIFIYSLLAF